MSIRKKDHFWLSTASCQNHHHKTSLQSCCSRSCSPLQNNPPSDQAAVLLSSSLVLQEDIARPAACTVFAILGFGINQVVENAGKSQTESTKAGKQTPKPYPQQQQEQQQQQLLFTFSISRIPSLNNTTDPPRATPLEPIKDRLHRPIRHLRSHPPGLETPHEHHTILLIARQILHDGTQEALPRWILQHQRFQR